MTRDEAMDLIWNFEDAILHAERNFYKRRYNEDREEAREKLLSALTANKQGGDNAGS